MSDTGPISDGDTITTAEALDRAPVGTTFIDTTDELVVKIADEQYAMPVDMGNGERWAYFDRSEVIGAIHSPGSINAPDEHHVPYSTFLPMRVHQTPF